jgi:hypothetical protein
MDGLLGNLFGVQEEDPLLRLLPPEQRAILQNQARSQGTTNLGLALLQAGGPTRTPTGAGALLGQAGMQAMQANQGIMDRNLERLMTARRLQQEQTQLERKEQFRKALPGLFSTQTVTPPVVDAQGRPGAGEVRPPVTTTEFDQNAAMRLAMEYPEFAKDYFGGVSSVRDLFKPVIEKYGEGETLFDVRTGKPIAQGTPKSKFKPGDTRDFIQGNQRITQEFQTDGTWKVIAQGSAFAAPTQVNVGVTTGRKFGETFGGEIAKQDAATLEAARKAPSTLQTIQSTRNILDTGKVITGFGANQILDVAKLGQQLGVTGKDTNEIIANTEGLFANRAQATLDSIRASGLGTGQGFSNADRDFLEKARLGSIKFTPAALQRQLDIEESVTRATANAWNTRLKQISPDVITELGLQPVEVPPPVQRKTGKAGRAPSGVSQDVWDVMTDEQRSLWRR